jgi:hypothetical protein
VRAGAVEVCEGSGRWVVSADEEQTWATCVRCRSFLGVRERDRDGWVRLPDHPAVRNTRTGTLDDATLPSPGEEAR